MAVTAGKAMVRVYADNTALIRGLKKAEQRLRAFGAGARRAGMIAAGIGAAVLAPIALAVKAFMNWGDTVDKMSKRTGLGAEFISELAFAAEQSGASIENVEKAVKAMQSGIFDAGRNVGTLKDGLEALGLTVDDLKGLSPEAQFSKLADVIASVEDPTLQAGIAMKLFGMRAGPAILPMLQNFRELQEIAARLGLTMSKETAAAAAEATDAFHRLKMTFRAIYIIVGAALAPQVIRLANILTNVMEGVVKFVRANAKLIKIVVLVGLGLVAAGAALITVGIASGMAGFAVSGFLVMMGAASAVLAAFKTVLLAIISPIGLVVAALAALGYYIIVHTDAGRDALGKLSTAFRNLLAIVWPVIQAIGKALLNGEIGLAVKILWLTLKVAFLKGTEDLTKVWADFKYTFLALTSEIWYGALEMLVNAWHGMGAAWTVAIAFMKKAWTSFSTSIQATWARSQGAIAKGFYYLMSLADDTLDYEEGAANIDSSTRNTVDRLDQEKNKSLAENDKQRDSDLARIGQENLDVNAQLEDDKAAGDAARTKGYLKDLSGTNEALIAARAAWKSAVDKGLKLPGLPGLDDFKSKKKKTPGMGGGAVSEKIETRGTFNAAALSQMGASTAAERTATASEAAAKNTKKIAKNTESPLLFV